MLCKLQAVKNLLLTDGRLAASVSLNIERYYLVILANCLVRIARELPRKLKISASRWAKVQKEVRTVTK